ncbi:MAG: heparan-alpha-glucosaminide N-acetyltransferase domain-containing protein [Bryobacteraceae bacterium]
MQSSSNSRLLYLDWMRGLAALIMLVGHTFHSFTRIDLRDSGPYMLSQFIGGMPPAIFLFLTGVTLAFLMDGRQRKGLPPAACVAEALRRAGYLLAIAFLFRLQLWLFGLPKSPWTDLLRVDILNSMALAAAVMGPLALLRTAQRVRAAAALGLGIAVAAPLVSQLDWSMAPALLKAYLAPDYASFGFFPWAAFLAFGLSAGSLVRLSRPEQMERTMQWAALTGTGLIAGGNFFGSLPYSLYIKSDFWLDSPALILIKLGVIFWLAAFAYLWTHAAPAASWSWIRQLGTTSLLVYWAHVELVYGRWFWAWKENLTLAQVAIASLAVVALMLALSTAKTWWQNNGAPPAAVQWLMARRLPAPRRVSGD